MLHLHATGGAGPDGRDGPHPLHIGQRDVSTPLQQLQILVRAVVVVTAVAARRPPLPGLQTLPAEPLGGLVAVFTDVAVKTEIV